MALHEIQAPYVDPSRGAEIPGQFTQPVQPGQPVQDVSDVFEGYQDYFGFDDYKRYYLPDGRQYIEFRVMNEGQRSKFEKKTSRDVRFNRRTDDAAIKVDAAEDRHALIEASVTNWHVVRRNASGKFEPVPFTIGSQHASFNQWIDKADPRIVNDLHQEIVKANPWLNSEMNVEMIDEEIKKLQEMRDEAVKREAAEKNSASR